MVTKFDTPGDEQRAKDMPPHMGLWHKMTDSQVTIFYALEQIGINPHGGYDKNLPDDTIGLYFGPEPP